MCSILSGALSILIYMGSPTDIFTNEQVDFGNWIAENTATDAVFIGDKSTEQPVATLGGRPVMSGFPGWVVSHGLDLYKREGVINNMVLSPENIEKFDEYSVSYVFMGTTNEMVFRPGEDSEHWQLLYDEPNITLWGRI